MGKWLRKRIGGLAGAGSEPSAADSVAMASIKHAANFLVRPLQAAARLRFWTVQLLSVHRSELQTSASALPPGGGGRHNSFGQMIISEPMTFDLCCRSAFSQVTAADVGSGCNEAL